MRPQFANGYTKRKGPGVRKVKLIWTCKSMLDNFHQQASAVANLKRKTGKCEISSVETRSFGEQASSALLGVEENRKTLPSTHTVQVESNSFT